uniref:ATP-dependent RNA helicase n=1 Tax=Panagrellus redivivus TaxID=6233 RepID=A0A7E4VX70_PANRE
MAKLQIRKKKAKRAPVINANAPPPPEEDAAFSLESMIEEIDPSQVVGLNLKTFVPTKRKLEPEGVEAKKAKVESEPVVEEPKKEETKVKKVVKKAPKKAKKAAKVAPVAVADDGPKTRKEKKKERLKEKQKQLKATKAVKVIEKAEVAAAAEKENDLDMSAWDRFYLPPEIIKGLRSMKYTAPTEIQELTIPAAMLKRVDILGAAETGSGKTMAFAIPFASILVQDEPKEGIRALILAPTRELANQIYHEVSKLVAFTPLTVLPLFGGLCVQKQERLLKRKPAICIATPGRFWSLVESSEYLEDMSNLDFVIIDEMDRMVETGHFAELELILERIHSIGNKRLQTLAFSATLSFVHVPVKRAGKVLAPMSREQKIAQLVQLGGLRSNHKVIDLNASSTTPKTLVETRINCADLLDKDAKVYYLLKRYTGRTLIFANSIDGARRLCNLLKTMDIEPVPALLHAKMQQRARLKHLERFATTPNAILIATDVAARGLDIKGIENVIHYQIPRTAEGYVHRSGRTARISNKGIAILMVDPLEVSYYRRICQNLQKDKDFPVFDIDAPTMFNAAKERTRLATFVEQLQHRLVKITTGEAWNRRAASEADIEEIIKHGGYNEDDALEGEDPATMIRRDLKNSTAQLKALLRQPLSSATGQTVERTSAIEATPLAKPALSTKLFRAKNKAKKGKK